MVAVFTRAYEVMQQRLDRLRNQRRLATDFHISRLFEKRELDYRLKKVTARPAAEEDGLQVADMIAGAALDEATGGSHGYLARLGEKLEIIQVPEKENRPG